ncbi:hypothetical protein K2B15_004894 [Salmonella enterica subsp. enterica serovar Muenster]|nr:hypothetical protein [Salmonella enterica subsp. enterica serovar Muenster]EGP2908858.1 hypothetical protein [Salmonella enterica subsp. enterica serovar Muenster]EGP3098608.1 hypothetical protein [Salmonella enterica subsp. enterica serovar Infantis]EHX6840607.1 hypothetical protein [Salmonella enterica subsp. enterica serovar Muenster]
MLTYITDIKAGEPDILTPLKHYPLVIRSLDGAELHMQNAPEQGWTYDTLRAVQPEGVNDEADAYLNEHWIGSTEV